MICNTVLLVFKLDGLVNEWTFNEDEFLAPGGLQVVKVLEGGGGHGGAGVCDWCDWHLRQLPCWNSVMI
jgi:hypothetical protein